MWFTAVTTCAISLPNWLQRGQAFQPKLLSAEEYDRLKGQWVKETEGIPIAVKSAATKKAKGIFARLLAAGERLMAVIAKNEGGANKDLAKFADQIHSLCDKWDR